MKTFVESSMLLATCYSKEGLSLYKIYYVKLFNPHIKFSILEAKVKSPKTDLNINNTCANMFSCFQYILFYYFRFVINMVFNVNFNIIPTFVPAIYALHYIWYVCGEARNIQKDLRQARLLYYRSMQKRFLNRSKLVCLSLSVRLSVHFFFFLCSI